SAGRPVAATTTTITVTIVPNSTGATLSGVTSMTPINGIATFSTLSVDKLGSGYTLKASANGLNDAKSAPFSIVPSFTSISTGGPTCALVTNGTAYCWGLNSDGELGVGSITGPQICGEPGGVLQLACSSSPALVSGGLTFSQISTGGSASCGLTYPGQAYCWGYNAYGQLGNNSVANSARPALVSGGLTFALISVGYEFACGLTNTRVAYCWGRNDGTGALGNGTTTDSPTPVAVSGGLNFIALSAGVLHTCALVQEGHSYCWGVNEDGELGNGTTASGTI